MNKNIKLNFKEGEIESKLVVWNKDYITAEKVDYIIMAECLYYEKWHDDLLGTIKALMHDKSVCLIIAPKRGNSMQLFIEKAKTDFVCEVNESITPEVDKKIEDMSKDPLFNPNEHKPYLIKLYY